jgi:hypothetical protein
MEVKDIKDKIKAMVMTKDEKQIWLHVYAAVYTAEVYRLTNKENPYYTFEWETKAAHVSDTAARVATYAVNDINCVNKNTKPSEWIPADINLTKKEEN